MPGRVKGRSKVEARGRADAGRGGRRQEGPAPRGVSTAVAGRRLPFLEEGSPSAQPLVAAELELAGRSSPVGEEALPVAAEGEATVLAASPAGSVPPSSPLWSSPRQSETEEEQEEFIPFPGPSQPQTEGTGGPQKEPAVPPPLKRGRTGSGGSMVADHFELGPRDPTHAAHTHCRAQASQGKNPKRFATSGILRHMQRRHPGAPVPAGSSRPEVFSVSGKAPAPKLPARQLQPVSKPSDCPKPQLITQAIAEMIALDDQPLQVVENVGFRRLLQQLAPDYEIPSCATLSRRVVPSLYRVCREAVSGLLRMAAPDTSVHFAADLCTSTSGLHASFLSLAAHWWGQESEGTPVAGGVASPSQAAKQRWVLLHVEVLDTSHTAEELSVTVDRQVEGWLSGQPNLRRGLMVTGDGLNLARAVEQLGFVSIRCVAHTLNLIVQDALGLSGGPGSAKPPPAASMASLFERCCNIAAYFHESKKGRQMLKEKQLELGLPERLIPQYVPAQWNSAFLLLQWLQEQEQALHSLARWHDVKVCDLFIKEWILLCEVVSTLEPFFTATNNLCTEEAMLSLALPAAYFLEKTMGQLQSTLKTQEAVALAGRLRTGVVDRLRTPLSASAEHVLSCLCDPRMKDRAVTPDELPRWRALLVEEVLRAQERRLGPGQEAGAGGPSVQATPRSSSNTATACRSSSVEYPGGPREPPHWSEWFTKNLYSVLPGFRELSTGPRGHAERCVQQYFLASEADPETDPLQFWATRRQVWPDLAAVAERLLSCPPSSVQSKRVFSRDGATPHCSGSEAGMVEQLVFLKANLPLLGYPALAMEGE
ncbi:zinc finger BED domain-containing protein 4-like [Hemicordylus capensis]|uniref:zinc finger BED domain-containing protein 4-like n=1 Tax=Hemicordylus capensis TaxID=884348 RepID=UPI002304651D|nr:zinc finger BED domain-containing protein 4-like [Hemicordylus capensis]